MDALLGNSVVDVVDGQIRGAFQEADSLCFLRLLLFQVVFEQKGTKLTKKCDCDAFNPTSVIPRLPAKHAPACILDVTDVSINGGIVVASGSALQRPVSS